MYIPMYIYLLIFICTNMHIQTSNIYIYIYQYKGMVVKKSYHSMWVAYLHSDSKTSPDEYTIIGAFPPNPTPSPAMISNLYTDRR
jgi:hypothetical protein